MTGMGGKLPLAIGPRKTSAGANTYRAASVVLAPGWGHRLANSHLGWKETGVSVQNRRLRQVCGCRSNVFR